MHELEDYIDAQNGGPGKGWYRIVDDPVEARAGDQRRQARGGHGHGGLRALRLPPDAARRHPALHRGAELDDGIDEIYDLGVRQLEIVNKFDNALTGVAGDSGTTGTITNGGNFLSAGSFWDLEHCDEPVNHDHSPTAPCAHNDDELIANGLDLFGDSTGITPPVYGAAARTATSAGSPRSGEAAIDELHRQGHAVRPRSHERDRRATRPST